MLTLLKLNKKLFLIQVLINVFLKKYYDNYLLLIKYFFIKQFFIFISMKNK